MNFNNIGHYVCLCLSVSLIVVVTGLYVIQL